MPIFSGLTERAAGVLLHPTALPSRQGIGHLGAPARDFVDFLAQAGFSWWQVCPLGPTGFGDSPYSCFSAFAGNPYLVDLDAVRDAGLLAESDLAPLRALSSSQVEYGYLWEHFQKIAAAAWRNAKASPEKVAALGDLAGFRKRHADWLEDFSLFSALKRKHAGKPWSEWPAADRAHTSARRQAAADPAVRDDADREVIWQFIFFTQRDSLHTYAKTRGVKLLGDAPIYVAMDSADTWSRPELFELNARTLAPTFVAGVPPDYFSETGQLWGNPLYDWKRNAADGYAWWISRLRALLDMTDGLRIDHFRAFHDYWMVPAGAKDARGGKWGRGPGAAFFRAVHRELGDRFIVAEDLGALTPGVHTLRDECGFPGMAILQFAFGDTAANPYLPHNATPNLVVYPGTHDNATAVGWYAALDPVTRDRFRTYFGTDGRDAHWTLLRACMTSPARLAILPMQDLLGLGDESRFNTPGTPDGNWTWRLTAKDLAHAKTWLAPTLKSLATLTGRHTPEPEAAAPTDLKKKSAN